MARLIIGHVTNTSARIWVRGDSRYPWAHVRVEPVDRSSGPTNMILQLEHRHGFTGVVEATGLIASTAYECEVEFSSEKNTPAHRRADFGHCRGRLQTAPDPDSAEPFSFLLGSCNLHSLGGISSPDRAFEELLGRSEEASARFMIHCGDQIYYDIPAWAKPPDVEEYRAKYLDAWGDSRPARRFLTQLPQYMILDDHEITNDFANDFESPNSAATPQLYRAVATKVYREFAHIRHPAASAQALWYAFPYGKAQFFVMDTRTERWSRRQGGIQIIGNDQMAAFKSWLKTHADAPKFVVTSVPFVGTVKQGEDKWSAAQYQSQRHEIIQYLADNNISGVVFLTGDMHNSYHATMTIDGTITVHELMSSPINQLSKTSFDRYLHSDSFVVDGTSVKVQLKRTEFYNDHSNAMVITLDDNKVDWKIFRTKRSRQAKKGSFVL